jgi:hypothetical protein
MARRLSSQLMAAHPPDWWHNVIFSSNPECSRSRPMGEFTTLMARDGHEFNAWLTAPSQPARGAVVIAQEIFGVNRHIRAVADGFAADGYVTIAPCLFDRIRRGIELGYSEAEVQQGRGYRLQIPKEKTLLDLTACINVIKHSGRVSIVGYCWGGTLAYIAACELPCSARCLTKADRSRITWRNLRAGRCNTTSVRRIRTFRRATSTRSAPPTRTAFFISIRPTTDSTATNAAPTMRPAPRSRASARCNS